MEILITISIALAVALATVLALFIGEKKTTQSLENAQKEYQKEAIEFNKTIAELKSKNEFLQEKIEFQKQETEKLGEKFSAEFKNLANDIFEEKTQKFTNLNEEKLSGILNPLKEKIVNFEKKVEENYSNEKAEKATLRKELEQIVLINKQMSDDAQRLTSALKGDKKFQGDWGEYQLELLLEHSGLQKGVHFLQQPNFKTEEGANVRPDYIIQLPDNKQYIIDSKISLVAYEQYFNAEDERQKERFLTAHINSIRQHISDLSNKNYQNLYSINSPDFVFMFFALEPALYIALQADTSLFERALQKNIVLVSITTLMATMRTVSFIWKQENQKNNVLEIARESGALYDKFVGFTEDMIKVGKTLIQSKETYDLAMNKLTESTKKGDTIIGRMENIKKLGANTTKNIDKSLVNRALNGTDAH